MNLKENYLSVRKLCFTIFILTFSFSGFSQDIIIKSNGDEIKSKVTEITTEFIKYRNFSQPSGPIRNININEVFIILYENGSREMIKKANYVSTNLEMVQTVILPVYNNSTTVVNKKSNETNLKPFVSLTPDSQNDSSTNCDLILKQNGEQINCFVTEITQDFLKYRKSEQPNGPIRNILCREVYYIQYKDGSREIINQGKSTIELSLGNEDTHINKINEYVDIILKINGEKLKADIIEITAEDIKYRLPKQYQGPLFSISLSECSSIIFKDGSTEQLMKDPKKKMIINENQPPYQLIVEECDQNTSFIKDCLNNQIRLVLEFTYDSLNVNELILQSHLQDNLDISGIVTRPEYIEICKRQWISERSRYYEPEFEKKLNKYLSQKWVKASKEHSSSRYKIKISISEIKFGDGLGPSIINSTVKIIDLNSQKCIYQYEINNSGEKIEYTERPTSAELLTDAFSSLGKEIGKYMIKYFY